MKSNVSDWKRGNSSMSIQPDFEEFLRLLEEHQVEYMIVGRYGQVDVTLVGKEDLIRNKSSTTRAKDKADVEELT